MAVPRRNPVGGGVIADCCFPDSWRDRWRGSAGPPTGSKIASQRRTRSAPDRSAPATATCWVGALTVTVWVVRSIRTGTSSSPGSGVACPWPVAVQETRLGRRTRPANFRRLSAACSAMPALVRAARIAVTSWTAACGVDAEGYAADIALWMAGAGDRVRAGDEMPGEPVTGQLGGGRESVAPRTGGSRRAPRPGRSRSAARPEPVPGTLTSRPERVKEVTYLRQRRDSGSCRSAFPPVSVRWKHQARTRVPAT